MGVPSANRVSSLVTASRRSQGVVAAVLLVGLVVRLSILATTPDLDARIADELQYVELADRVMSGRGFAWASGESTSLRPPLYPAFVAGIWSATGTRSLQAIRL